MSWEEGRKNYLLATFGGDGRLFVYFGLVFLEIIGLLFYFGT